MDPLNSMIRALTCVTLVFVGRNEEAIARCDEALRADPTQPVALDGRSIALKNLGRRDEYLANEIVRSRSMGDEEYAQVLEQGYEEGGFERAMALAAELLVARSEVEYVPPDWVATSFADAGEAEKALDWLERALEMGTPSMPYAAAARWPEEVQTHPRFRELIRRMGLPGRD